MDIFLSRSYIFWLGVSAWLLWAMSIWLLLDLRALPGRQSCLNCCMPLERASLMGLLECQSVSGAFSLFNIPAWTCRAALMMQQTALVLVMPLRRLWPEGVISLSCRFFRPSDVKLESSCDGVLCWCLLGLFLCLSPGWSGEAMCVMKYDSHALRQLRRLISQTVTT